MSELKRVLIIAGGTGGHVFPGLAVAEYLRKNNVDVSWIGTLQGLEARLVPEAKFPIHFISISGVRGKRLKEKLLAPMRLIHAISQALKWIRQYNPDVVIGMGGFVSGPGGIASVLLRKKLLIHEQNAKPGLTNQWLSRVAHKILEAFPNTFRNRKNVITVGNPVRTEITLLPFKDRRSEPLHLLVLGGSLGAQAINQLLPKALAKIPAEIRPKVLHQTGEKHCSDTVNAYKQLNLNAEIVPFIKEMNKAYAWADMVLCRAGALTITELCAVGLGAILIPYPYAVDDHQTANAEVMVSANAALLMQQAELRDDMLADILTKLCSSADKTIDMAKAAYHIRRIDAAEKIFTICKEMCH